MRRDLLFVSKLSSVLFRNFCCRKLPLWWVMLATYKENCQFFLVFLKWYRSCVYLLFCCIAIAIYRGHRFRQFSLTYVIKPKIIVIAGHFSNFTKFCGNIKIPWKKANSMAWLETRWYLIVMRSVSKRQQIQLHLNRVGSSAAVEQQLFHGTRDEEVVRAIFRQNFDWRMNGNANDVVYGRGAYFALNASFSHRYLSLIHIWRCRRRG